MNLWRTLYLSWQTSPTLYRLLWLIVSVIHVTESLAAACVGMAYGPNLVYLNVGFTGLFLASSTHLMVSSGVKRATLGKRPLRNQQMTTDRAEGLLAEFTCFRGPITAAWAHRWAHAAGLALVVFAYLLVTVCDVSHLPLGLLIFLALVLSTLNSYLILLLGINYTWAKLLDGLRRASGEWKDERISQGGKQGLRLTRSFTTRTRAIHQRFHRQR